MGRILAAFVIGFIAFSIFGSDSDYRFRPYPVLPELPGDASYDQENWPRPDFESEAAPRPHGGNFDLDGDTTPYAGPDPTQSRIKQRLAEIEAWRRSNGHAASSRSEDARRLLYRNKLRQR